MISRNESQELYLHRNEGSDEDRALLAIGLHQQNIMAREQQQLAARNRCAHQRARI